MKEQVYNIATPINFKNRVVEPELIDNFEIAGRKLKQTLWELEWVNKYLGGISTSLLPVFKFIQINPIKKTRIVDIGCGTGDILKKLAEMGKRYAFKLDLTGIDANKNMLDFAHSQHFNHSQAKFIQSDIILEPEKIPEAEVYMLNQFLHHFEMKDIKSLLGVLLAKKPKLIVVNDLQRSQLAYSLFTWLCKFKHLSNLTSHDGQLSITKGFNKKEMKMMGEMAYGYSFHIKWNWAFRWQLVMCKEPKKFAFFV